VASTDSLSAETEHFNVAGLTRYTREGRHKEVATPRADSKEEQWKHLVYVFEGQRKPSRVYVDGKKALGHVKAK
jgi:hypothetical protein